MSSALLSSLGKGSQGQSGRSQGSVLGRSVAQHAPGGSGQAERPGQANPQLLPQTQLGSHRLLHVPEARAQGSVASLPNPGLLPPGYCESWSSLAFCRIWQTSVMG